MPDISFQSIVDFGDESVYDIRARRPGSAGRLPLTHEALLERSCGDLFGWAQDAGMGWDPAELSGPEVLILSTQGGLREPDGLPVALGYHTGHFEVHLLVEAAARELKRLGAIPFAGYLSLIHISEPTRPY